MKPFRDVSEVVERANNSVYGLAASVWTHDVDVADYVSSNLQAGVVWINTYFTGSIGTPFGGYKQSGNLLCDI